MSDDPLIQARYFIEHGLPESGTRVTEIRKKFIKLMHSSHEFGAGGVVDSERYRAYREVARLCHYRSMENALESTRKKNKK